MKKTISLLLIFCMVFCLVACNTDMKEEIIGEWKLTEVSKKIKKDFYPEERTLIFFEDGTWNNEETNTYIINDNNLVMDSDRWVSKYTYIISIEDDILELAYPGETPIFFERVS